MTGDIFGGGGRRLKLVHAVAPTLGEHHEARRIRRTARLWHAAAAATARGWRGSIPGYLDSPEWRPVPDGSTEMGCSWLELLIDFELTNRVAVRRAELLLRDEASLLRREGALSETIRLFQAETLSQVRDVFTLDVRNICAP